MEYPAHATGLTAHRAWIFLKGKPEKRCHWLPPVMAEHTALLKQMHPKKPKGTYFNFSKTNISVRTLIIMTSRKNLRLADDKDDDKFFSSTQMERRKEIKNTIPKTFPLVS